MPAFTAAAVPHFTLYGDGTVIFRNPMLEPPPAEGSVFKMNPLRTAKLSEEQIQDLLMLALTEGGLAVARPEYRNDMVADAGDGDLHDRGRRAQEDRLGLCARPRAWKASSTAPPEPRSRSWPTA